MPRIAGRSDPTASSTARRSSTLVSRLGASTLRLDRPGRPAVVEDQPGRLGEPAEQRAEDGLLPQHVEVPEDVQAGRRRRRAHRRRPDTRCSSRQWFARSASHGGPRAHPPPHRVDPQPEPAEPASLDCPGHGRDASRHRREAGPRRARPRGQGGRARPARRRLRGDLHGAAPDPRADRRDRDPGGRRRGRPLEPLGRAHDAVPQGRGGRCASAAPATSWSSAGGIIPADDIPALEAAGIEKVFTPGASTGDIAAWLSDRLS